MNRCSGNKGALSGHSASYGGSPDGFTLLEMIIVMFLLGGVLVLVVPRITVGEDLASTGRKFIGVLRSLQSMAVVAQKPVKLYLDLDRGTYWIMIVEGKEEKIPLDAMWRFPRSLPETIKFTDISVGQTKRLSGRIDLSFSPNGRIDPLTVHFGDTGNQVLAIAVESLTGAIRTSDERIEPLRPQPIPERIKPLLQTPQGPTPASLGIRL
jgi:prepilin-type N-terminal cleavage/methylation domain-containing protein